MKTLSGTLQFPSFTIPFTVQRILKYLFLGVLDAFILLSIYIFIGNGNYVLAIMVALILVGINIVVISQKFYPFKWFALGLSLIAIMLVYPTLQTIYAAFTNYGEGHLLTKVQVLDQLTGITYLPEGGNTYSWTAYRNEAGDFALWLQNENGAWLAYPDQELIEGRSASGIGSLDSSGVPESLANGYERINRINALRFINNLSEIQFGTLPQTVTVISLDSAEERLFRYIYDSASDTITDRTDNRVYSPVDGTFTAQNGDILQPGYSVVIGFENFNRLFTSPSLRGPFTQVFIWTFVYAGVSVFLAFGFGLFFAIIFDHPRMKAKKVVRSLLLIPYAIPAFISVSVWKGMFQQHIGLISIFLENTFGSSPLWFADPFWAKVGIFIIQTWLGYPYMMLICTGALQSIPREIYEAARIDGANPLQQFWNLTLPLLLVAVGPLLIASFAFNFNNFTIIDIYSEGGPPIANTLTPAGHTDILITYIFRLAFSGGRGADLAYASAITIVIFFILATITAFQFRYTRVWEEISENV